MYYTTCFNRMVVHIILWEEVCPGGTGKCSYAVIITQQNSPGDQSDGVLTDLLPRPAVHHGRVGVAHQVRGDHGVLSEADHPSQWPGGCGLSQPLANIRVESGDPQPGGQVQH